MIKFFNSLLLIILVSVLVRPVDARTKKPEWVVNYGHSKQYSNQKFITGFGSSTGINNESREIAQDNALTDLSRSLTVNVDSTVESQNIDYNGQLSQSYNSITQSSTAIRLVGLQKEIFVENRRKNPTTYCLAYVQRSKLSRLYQQEKNKLQREIAELVQLAETENNQKELVLKSYFQMLPLFEKLKEVEIVLLSVGRTSYMGDSVLDQVAITIPSENYIRNTIDQLVLY